MTDGVPDNRRFAAFIPVAIAVTMAVLDSAIVNVALPSIAQDLSLRPEQSIWIVNAYNLAITISLLPLASLGDSIGYKRVYWWGLTVFTVGSFVCAYSPSLLMFAVARFLQGLGAAGIMSVNIALVRYIFPKAQLGVGMGYASLIVAVSSAAGPSVAAAVLAVADWHWLFLVNVPFGVAALALGARFLPLTPTSGHMIDRNSILLNAVTFGLLIAGINSLGSSSDEKAAIGMVAAALVIGIVFVCRERRLAAPILPVDLLRMPVFALSLVTSIGSFAAQSMGFVAIPFFLENGLGYSQTGTGVMMTAWPLMTALVAPYAGRLSDRFAPQKIAAIGLLLLAAGWTAVALAGPSPSAVGLAWRLGVCGLGFGLLQSPNNRVIMGSAPRERSGGASGLQSMGRLLGQSFGAALVAVLFAFVDRDPTKWVACCAAGLSFLAACASVVRRPPAR